MVSKTQPEATCNSVAAAVRHGYADVDGGRVHYTSLGQGPLLILLHGFPDFWLTWWRQMHALSSRFHVVAPDLRGYNLSLQPQAPEEYRPEKLVGDVLAVADALGERQFGLVGQDWGGFTAWHVAMQAPERATQLAVLAMPHPWAIYREVATNPRQQAASAYTRNFQHPQAHHLVPREPLSRFFDDPEYVKLHREAIAHSSMEGILNYYKACFPSHPYTAREDSPPPVKCRTLLMHGLADPYALPEGLNDVWRWIDAELTTITLPRAGHFLQHECADRVTSELQSWLR